MIDMKDDVDMEVLAIHLAIASAVGMAGFSGKLITDLKRAEFIERLKDLLVLRYNKAKVGKVFDDHLSVLLEVCNE